MNSDPTVIVPAQQSHAFDLAPRMKLADVMEVWESHQAKPLEALIYSWLCSKECYSVIDDGRVEMMFGACDTPVEGEGIVWMLSADIPMHRREWRKRFFEESERYLAKLHERYALLYNDVDARNKQSLMWTKKLGFEQVGFVEVGASKTPFIRIESRR